MHVFQKLLHNLILSQDSLTNFKANMDFIRKTVELDSKKPLGLISYCTVSR